MAAHRISPRGLDFIKGFESFVPHVYDDKRPPVRQGRKLVYVEWQGEPVRGTLTIGYGHTNAARHPLKIKQGLRISEKQACEILDADLDDVEAAVNRMVKVPLTQGQYDALTSFTFNCGAGNLAKLIVPLNRGDYAGTRRKFALYVRAQGEVLQGLVRRRAGEQALWDLPDNDVAPAPDKPEVDPVDEPDVPAPDAPVLTPKEIDKPPPALPPAADKSIKVGVGGGVLAWLLSTAGDVWDKIKELPYSVEQLLTRGFEHAAGKPAFWVALAGGLGLASLYAWWKHRSEGA